MTPPGESSVLHDLYMQLSALDGLEVREGWLLLRSPVLPTPGLQGLVELGVEGGEVVCHSALRPARHRVHVHLAAEGLLVGVREVSAGQWRGLDPEEIRHQAGC